MKELDYHPNLNARSLVSHSQVIGPAGRLRCLLSNPFFPTVLVGISRIASDYDYAIQISTGQDEEHRLENLKQMILKQGVRRTDLYSKQDDPLVDFAVRNNFPSLS